MPDKVIIISNRFHVAVRLFNNRSQRTSKYEYPKYYIIKTHSPKDASSENSGSPLSSKLSSSNVVFPTSGGKSGAVVVVVVFMHRSQDQSIGSSA